MLDTVKSASISDKAIAVAVSHELDRQQNQIELIASENIVSRDVLLAQGSVLTNKYAEGYPGRRYYGGCEHVDTVEAIAIDRLKELFGAGFANVQPHSGAQANQAVFLALLKPGDRIMGLDGAWRAPDAWIARHHVGQMVRRGQLRSVQGRSTDRHGQRTQGRT